MTTLVPSRKHGAVPAAVALVAVVVCLLFGSVERAQAERPEMWFPVGERMSYTLYWGIIPVGSSQIWSEWVTEDDRDLIAIHMTARSGTIISAIYPIRDHITSYVDPVTFKPVRYVQKLKEGKKVRDDVYEFDYKAGVARWADLRDNESGEIDIDANTRDILSFVYYMRSKGYEVGKTEKFKVLVEEKVYDLAVTGLKNTKVYLSSFGKVECLKLKPEARFGEIFVRKGAVNVWFSNDERKVCSKISGELPVANVKAILRSVDGPGDDFWTQRSKKNASRTWWGATKGK